MKKIIVELLEQYEKDMDMPQFAVQYYTDEYIISKHYGFIKRLVDNDKIDRVEVWSTGMTKPTYGYTTEPYTTCKSIKLENTILMVLSIQDEPIEFLCSILK